MTTATDGDISVIDVNSDTTSGSGLTVPTTDSSADVEVVHNVTQNVTNDVPIGTMTQPRTLEINSSSSSDEDELNDTMPQTRV